MSKIKKTTVPQRGNPIANNPLMRKGGVHTKLPSSKRQKQKRETHRLLAKYMETPRRRSDENCYFSRRPIAKFNYKGSN